MDSFGWIQLALYMLILGLLTKPMGLYLVKVLDPDGVTILDPVIGPLERLLYRLLRVDPKRGQDWKRYSLSLITFSSITMLLPMPFYGCSIFCRLIRSL